MLLPVRHIITILSMLLCIGLAQSQAGGVCTTTNGSVFLSGQPNVVQKINKRIINQYKKDAARLALRIVEEDKSLDNAAVNVPKELVQGIFEALIAIHQSNLEMAEMVTDLHRIHTFPVPAVDAFLVIYEKDATWAKPLESGEKKTSHPVINQLSQKFNLNITKANNWDEEHRSLTFKSLEALNMTALAKTISTVEGVKMVKLPAPNGYGNDISAKKLNNGWEISYMINWDKCMTNCEKQHKWIFNVSDNGIVKFVKEAGDTLPEWLAVSR